MGEGKGKERGNRGKKGVKERGERKGRITYSRRDSPLTLKYIKNEMKIVTRAVTPPQYLVANPLPACAAVAKEDGEKSREKSREKR